MIIVKSDKKQLINNIYQENTSDYNMWERERERLHAITQLSIQVQVQIEHFQKFSAY